MRTFQELTKRAKQYIGSEIIYLDGKGYIVYQCSTGENYEILFIEVAQKRKGYGKLLIQEMCKKIKPYYSIFVVRRAINEEAGKFYRALGFEETLLKGLYKNEDAVIGIIPYDKITSR